MTSNQTYVDSQLLTQETVLYRARLHWIIYLPAAAFAIVLLGLSLFAKAMARPEGPSALPFVMMLLFIPLIWAAVIYVKYHTSEFAVTNKRVIRKSGWIRRQTIETMLEKVEGVNVDQSLIGRLFDFGTITVSGTGGTKEPVANIAHPLEFHRQVRDAIERLGGIRSSPDQVLPTVERDEIECPFCAELILRKARVCKYCNRELPKPS